MGPATPGLVILSCEMMLGTMGWTEAPAPLQPLIIKGMDGAISAKTVTCDFEHLMKGAKPVGCSQFGQEMIKHNSL